jgi:hypothetical protein
MQTERAELFLQGGHMCRMCLRIGFWTLFLTAALVSILLTTPGVTRASDQVASQVRAESTPGGNVPTNKIPEEVEYAARVLMDPWDMNQPTDLYPSGLGDRPGEGFSGPLMKNGVFTGTTENPIAYLWLLYHGFPNINQIDAHNGLVNPIDADKYRYLTFRLYLAEANPDVPVRAWWSKAGDEVTGPCGASTTLQPYAGWHIYRLDLSTNVVPGHCPWSGQVTGLLLSPTSTTDSTYKAKLVALDWVRLSDPTSATPVTINWDMGSGSGEERSVSLLLDDDDQPDNGVLETLVANLPSARTGSYVWGAKGLPPGTYNVHARAGSDYAGTVLGAPWDFKEQTDYQVANVTNVTLNSSVLQATSTNKDPQVLPHIDPLHPIDAAVYHKLSARINVNATSDIHILWTRQGEGYGTNIARFMRIEPGWRTIEFDLDQNPLAGSWSGLITGLRFDPGTASGVTFQLDWIGLTSDAAAESEAELTSIMLPNVAKVTINQAPLLNFASPNKKSGQDYATTMLGAPWDFHDGSTIIGSKELATMNYSGGVMNAVTDPIHKGCIGYDDCGDPYLYFNVSKDPAKFINPNRFKYLTFDYWQEGLFNMGEGWIWRPVWRPSPPLGSLDFSVGREVLVRDSWPTYTEANGWHTYQMDLRKTLMDPRGGTSNEGWNDSHGWISQFRIDPTEMAAATKFHLKQVFLTADPVADGGPFTISWDLVNPDDKAKIVAYYTADKTSGERRKIGSAQQPDHSLAWNTENVVDGSYYVYLEADDGNNTTGIYSDVPVIVRHPPTVALTLPVRSQLRGDEFATDVLGRGWTMDDSTDIWMVHDITTPVFQNGLLSITTTGPDPYFYLRSDAARPIDTTRYRTLYYRMYSSVYSNMQVFWGRTGSPLASSDLQAIMPGWHIYRVDLGAYATWTGNVETVRLDPPTDVGVQMQVDWVKLTDPNSALYQVNWSTTGAADARLAIFASQTPEGVDPAPLATGLGPSLDTFTVDLSWMDPGYYIFYAEIDNQINSVVQSRPVGPLRIARQETPTIELSPPSLHVDVAASEARAQSTYSVTLDNMGLSDYTWTATSTVPWVTVDQNSGSEQPARLHMTVSLPEGQSAGLFTGKLTVLGSGVGQKDMEINLDIHPPMIKVYLPTITRAAP